MMSNKLLIGTATAHASGSDTAAVCLYSDGSLAYTTKLGVAKTRWQWADKKPSRLVEFKSVSLASDSTGTMTVAITYTDGAIEFAKVERFFDWHIVNHP